jgi:hypothetical protein
VRALAAGACAGFLAAVFVAAMQPPVYVWRGEIDFREYHKQLDVTQVSLFAGAQMPEEEHAAQERAWRLFKERHGDAQRSDVHTAISTRENGSIFKIRVTATRPEYCRDYFDALAIAFAMVADDERKKLVDLEQAELNVEEKKGSKLTESHLPKLRQEIGGLKNSSNLIKDVPGLVPPRPEIRDWWVILLVGMGGGAAAGMILTAAITATARNDAS